MDTSYIDQAIEAWISSVESISGSKGTARNYRSIMASFRAQLVAEGLDLDLAVWAERKNEDAWRKANALFRHKLATFARFRKDGNVASASTIAARISAIHSFFKYALDGFFPDYPDPTSRVQRPHVDIHGKVKPLETKQIVDGMASIDRSTVEGLRNDAMLRVFFETARRLSEVASLLWGDVEVVSGDLSRIKETIDELCFALRFRRIKGGKTAYHKLSHATSVMILVSMVRIYEMKPMHLEAERPLWPSLSTYASSKKFHALSHNGIRAVVEKVLGTTRVHRIRHSVAQQCLEAGMSLSDIAGFLGHSGLETLIAYLDSLSLKRGENPALTHIQRVFTIE